MQKTVHSAMISAYNRSCRASILVITLWVVCFLAALAVIVSGLVRQKIIAVQRFNARAQVRMALDAGLEQARAAALDFGAGQSGYIARSIEVASAASPIELGSVRVRVELEDEQRRVNINTAPLETLKRLAQACGVDDPDDLAASIIDWRDEDSVTLAPAQGAENSYYQTLRFPYRAKNGPFESIEELRLVKGVTPGLFRRLQGAATVYGDGRINFNTSSRDVLYAAGLSPSVVDALLEARNGDDGIAGTPDDVVFDSLEQIPVRVRARVRLNDSDLQELERVCANVGGVTSAYFKALIFAARGREEYRATGVVDVNGTVACWQEL